MLREVELGEPSDGRQQVVEVVGHSARQLPDGLHLGGLPQPGLELDFALLGCASLVLERPALGYVVQYHEPAGVTSSPIPDRGNPNVEPAGGRRWDRPSLRG